LDGGEGIDSGNLWQQGAGSLLPLLKGDDILLHGEGDKITICEIGYYVGCYCVEVDMTSSY